MVRGSGDPVALVPTALMADELLPLAERLRGRFRVVHYHRRGYAGSSPATPPGSVAQDAGDCARLLAARGVERVHVLGVSYSAAVALQMAVDYPDLIRTLTLVEPSPVHGPGDATFRAANAELLGDRQAQGAEAAVDRFLTRTVGPDWRGRLDGVVPGSSAQVTAPRSARALRPLIDRAPDAPKGNVSASGPEGRHRQAPVVPPLRVVAVGQRRTRKRR